MNTTKTETEINKTYVDIYKNNKKQQQKDFIFD